MASSRDPRGVKASPEGIKKLNQARSALYDEGAERLTIPKIAERARLGIKTVGNFLRGQVVDLATAYAICQVLKLKPIEILESYQDRIVPDNFGQKGPNPFNYGSPVEPDRFYGRWSARSDIKNRIGAKTAQSINIVGGRRVGKTSLLRYVRERIYEFCLPEQSPLVVTLDFQDRRFQTPEGIIEGLRRGIQRQYGQSLWDRDENEDSYAVEDGLMRLQALGYRLIVMIDEFERIARRLESFQDWAEDWRAKANSGLLTLIIGTRQPLNEIYKPLQLTSAFHNIFSTTVLEALEPEEWQRLVRDGFNTNTTDEVLKWIQRLTEGWPFLVQMAASLLWQHGDFDKAEAEFQVQIAPYSEQLPSLLGNEQGNIARVFISYRSQSPDAELAEEFYTALRAVGHHVFMASKSIQPGDDWPSRIEQEIEQCDYVLLLLSPQSAMSEMVTEEVRKARQLRDGSSSKKPRILPIRVNFPYSEPLNYDLRNYLSQIQQREWRSPDDTLRITQELLSVLANEEENSLKETPSEQTPLLLEPKLEPLKPLNAPGGSIALDSPYYVERLPIESDCYKEILKPGSLIRIKAPHEMGKTSLLIRILNHAQMRNFETVRLDFQMIDSAALNDLNEFLQWFCLSVTEDLALEDRLTDYWRGQGLIRRCQRYFERYLLPKVKKPLVLGLDELDRIFEYPKLASDFLGMLRVWHEEGKTNSIWKKLRIVVVHSTEIYAPLGISRSPFNVGLNLELSEFNTEQVFELVKRYELGWGVNEVTMLMKITGGHPYLIQQALFHLQRQNMTLNELVDTAHTEYGIYGDHLRRHWLNLQRNSSLVKALRQVISKEISTEIDAESIFKLRSMGLIKVSDRKVIFISDSYRLFFQERLGNSNNLNCTYYIFIRGCLEQVAVGQEVQIDVLLNAINFSDNGFLLEIPIGQAISKEVELNLVAPNFFLNTDHFSNLSLNPIDNDADHPQTATFNLLALQEGRHQISVDVYIDNVFKITLETEVEVAGLPNMAATRQTIQARSRPVPQPDLVCQVRTGWDSTLAACRFHYQLDAYHPQLMYLEGAEFQSARFSGRWLEQVRELVEQTLTIAPSYSPRDFQSRLAAVGQYLYQQLFPDELQAEFERISRLGTGLTLLILADQDGWVPWELVHDGERFWGDRFLIGRWLWELDGARPYEFPIGAVSVAHYSDVDEPEQWRSLLEVEGAPLPMPLPGGTLTHLHETETMRGLHLVRLGQSEAAMSRADAPVEVDDPESGMDIEQAMQPGKLTLRRNRPVVTVGYVSGGQAEATALAQTWVPTFVRAGCSGLIGPLWAVRPEVEAAFVSGFYRALWAGSSLGTAFQGARRLAQRVVPESMDWMAYVLVGDPMARPYRPVAGRGYAVVEPIGQDIDEPVAAGASVRFRASLRRSPPIWYENRLMDVAEDLSFESLQVYVMASGLGVAPAEAIAMTQTPTGDYLGWFTLTIPPEMVGQNPLVQVHFEDGEEPIHSLRFKLMVVEQEISAAGSEPGMEGDSA